ncbi:hypothetical protein [Pseudomonas putida]|nr:hypothetical protein [Pseudomonas putida]
MSINLSGNPPGRPFSSSDLPRLRALELTLNALDVRREREVFDLC